MLAVPLQSVGMGMVADQLAELKLGELLNTPPPGLDEAVAVAKVGGDTYACSSALVHDCCTCFFLRT